MEEPKISKFSGGYVTHLTREEHLNYEKEEFLKKFKLIYGDVLLKDLADFDPNTNWFLFKTIPKKES